MSIIRCGVEEPNAVLEGGGQGLKMGRAGRDAGAAKANATDACGGCSGCCGCGCGCCGRHGVMLCLPCLTLFDDIE